jgi:hypothetical protein
MTYDFYPFHPFQWQMANVKFIDILFLIHWVFFWGVWKVYWEFMGFYWGKKNGRCEWENIKKNDDVVLGGYVSLVFIDFHRQDFEAAGRYLDSD